MEKTLVLLKPDALQRGLIGKIVSRFEEKGLKMIAGKLLLLTDASLDEHYAHHKDKPFFPKLKGFMKSGPVFAMVWEGNKAVEIVRALCGATDGSKAAMGTIRGDYSMGMQNLIHASDSVETAEKEVKRFFKTDEIIHWKKRDFEDVYAQEERT